MVGSTTSLPSKHLLLEPQLAVTPSLTYTRALLQKSHTQINIAFIERVNLTIRQHVAAVGRRVNTLCKGEDGVRQQLALYQSYYNFCLPYASLRQPLPLPMATNGTGSTKQWRP
jgi:hypothetical protein